MKQAFSLFKRLPSSMQSTKLTILNFNRKLLNPSVLNSSFIKTPSSFFSTDESNKTNDTDSGLDQDFQPKVKVQVNNENVLQIVDDYVKKNDVCVFIKGTKEMPRCGFSNYLIQVLKFYKIDQFKDVNVLESDLMRNAVKEYSNWPTFPQLYIKGELVGGCDIIKEMHENGTFEDMLKSHGMA
mmetsp:Transcript_14959/g.15479  ORF Transcript_14959/g.15479 Transcript_14959/m.15479 type:complete len:183 (-) Transcript_14959:94-642(-)|eukprot:CAMPEP_0170514922 /NCGR_PEP_ID=MMETSP0209-20121228/1430_1 /TAXON_ID=665100 ORGANISM="Litonotus pictus, Strain P1" /NCGR_SAMPLE_ID=MMETSP0209 /ASSEMBLY_ACC=CAM_ASM_000301 /LENGTH=182 /DNA_ID=CAMNT_0010799191 /DNA_START=1 /DNA_END=549 /DNA_ORIENTATION=-